MIKAVRHELILMQGSSFGLLGNHLGVAGLLSPIEEHIDHTLLIISATLSQRQIHLVI